MSKSWQPGKRGARDLSRYISQHGKGTVVYTVSQQATSMAPWEDPELYSERVFDWRHPLTGHWMTGHKSVEGLLNTEGTVYEKPPRGMRALGSAPQVAGPLGHGDYSAQLDDDEIRGLNKRVRDGSDPATRQRLGGQRRH